ncbi:hypothetical protein ACU686_10885 [Yinghuangia aomiensis]
MVYKGRSRDTAWYSVIDAEWPRRRHGAAEWPRPRTSTRKALQKRSLSAIRVPGDV